MVAQKKILRLAAAAAAMTWVFASFWIGRRGIPIPQAATYLSYATTERTPLNSDTPQRCPTRGRRKKKSIPPNNIGFTSPHGIRQKNPRRSTVCHFKELTAWNLLGKKSKDSIFGESQTLIVVRRKRSGSSSLRNLIEKERRRPPNNHERKGEKSEPSILVRVGIGSECVRERKLILLAPLRSNEVET